MRDLKSLPRRFAGSKYLVVAIILTSVPHQASAAITMGNATVSTHTIAADGTHASHSATESAVGNVVSSSSSTSTISTADASSAAKIYTPSSGYITVSTTANNNILDLLSPKASADGKVEYFFSSDTAFNFAYSASIIASADIKSDLVGFFYLFDESGPSVKFLVFNFNPVVSTYGNIDLSAGSYRLLGEANTNGSLQPTASLTEDLSFNLTDRSGVPESSTWAMMLLGFGGIGFAMRRRRCVTALQQVA